MNKTVKFILGHFEEILASIFIVITTSLVLVNVFLRYFMEPVFTGPKKLLQAVLFGVFSWERQRAIEGECTLELTFLSISYRMQ